MKKILFALALLTGFIGWSQTAYEKGMSKAFELWGQGNSAEASALFERIASAEKDNWLPNYYVALVNTTESFQSQDKEKVSALLNKAQAALDLEMVKNPENDEILVMQALIYTGWVAFDPMTNGMKLSAKVMELYDQALKIAPENPRAVFGRAEYEMGGAKFFGGDIKPMCAEVDRSIGLFEKFKPATPYAPQWGKDRALMVQQECKK
ncbi:tetratricopeptide repeat protein [Flavobacterium caeni]|uniref:Tetratricopeptide repeat-containing protein n=1 Tax=Flavobacterium caeni TaxID=490189 RepID=A0A1G5AUB5_9FLAO|nr:hypothetical protein [Flavobacterium caeni]SCX81508.1 hypothetical protein SAMN02927903_00157 [Flavobacterium caeni]